jgi:hypothetical protein
LAAAIIAGAPLPGKSVSLQRHLRSSKRNQLSLQFNIIIKSRKVGDQDFASLHTRAVNELHDHLHNCRRYYAGNILFNNPTCDSLDG